METVDPFYYESAANNSNTTQRIKANKPPINTHAKSEILLHGRVSMNKNCAVMDGALLQEV